jgi:23S rRNA pseudouridine955/2504/2580 synthase
LSATESFWAELPLGRGVALLARDGNGLAALNKPAGVMSHPNKPGEEPRSLLNARYDLEAEVFEWVTPAGGTQRLWLLNRLDSATSGVILVAASAELAAEIRAHFKRKQVRKIYHALVFGSPSQPGQFWRDRLIVERKAGKVRASTGAGPVMAESQMTVVRLGVTLPRTALVRLEPRTGRTHQLRVQCAKRGLPIAGDQTYGDFARNREFARRAGTKRLFLHSTETGFDYEFRGRTARFEAKAPLPEEFESSL